MSTPPSKEAITREAAEKAYGCMQAGGFQPIQQKAVLSGIIQSAIDKATEPLLGALRRIVRLVPEEGALIAQDILSESRAAQPQE